MDRASIRTVSRSLSPTSTIRCDRMRHDPRGDRADRIRYGRIPLAISTELTISRLEGEVVTVLVGESEQKCIVHEQLLCARSPFFAAAFEKEWKEGQERTIPLPDDTPEVLDLYFQWIYSGKIFTREAPSKSDRGVGELHLLIESYTFGEKIQDRDYQDALLDSLLACTDTKDEKGERWFPTGELVRRAYEKTPTGSPLRRLLVDMHNHHGRSEWIKEDNSVEFLADLTREMFETRAAPVGLNLTDWEVDSCVYHHHGKEEQCFRSR